MIIRFLSVLCFGITVLANLSASAQAKPSKYMGQGLYEQNGSNSCLYCHGLGGQNGKVAISANLTHPKTWKSFKGAGGEAALANNREEFLARLEEAVVHTIRNGATIHNSGFKKDWYDVAKAGGTINSQMVGLGGSPSVAWLKKYSDRGVTKDIAAQSLYLYLKTLDADSVYSK
jgi:hypothetical protein